MQKKIIIILMTLVVAFIFCGPASAATVTGNNTTVTTHTSSPTGQFDPAIDCNRIVWVQGDSYGHTAVYYKNLATSTTGKVLSSTQNQKFPVHV
jgi:hypothetical protein